MIDLSKIGPQVIEIAKKTGDFILQERESFSMTQVEQKGLQNFVSYVDKEAEQKLVKALKDLIPEAGFIVEEQTAGHNKEDYIWIVDPLDGTTNFIHGVFPFAISIALKKGDDVILGVVFELGLKEAFYSWQGIDAYCNNKKITVRNVKGIANSLISTGFHTNDFTRLNGHLTVVRQVVENSHGLRRHGSAATDLAYLAAGRFDGFFEYGLSVWDVAAGAYLVQKAGGKISDYSGGNDFFYGRELCAGAPYVYDELIEIIKNAMF